ncbi:MAG: phage major capsid protein [Dehalococcoidia bacterium]
MKTAATMTLDEVVEEVKEIRPILKKAFAEGGKALDMDKVTAFGDDLDSHAKGVKLAEMNMRLVELGERKAVLTQADEAKAALDDFGTWLDAPAGGAPLPTDRKSDLYVPLWKSAESFMQTFAKGEKKGSITLPLDGKAFIDREMKTVMSTGAGYAPQALRTGVVIPAAFQTPTMIDLIPTVPSDQSAYVYMRQTTRTNNAAEILESVQGTLQTLAESAFVWTQITEAIQRIGHHVPVTDQQLKYVAGMLETLRVEMIDGVRERLSSQILNGDGTAPNIEGFLDAGRDTWDVDTAGEFIADAVDKLIEKCAVSGFAIADAVVMNNADWHGYRRATTSDGIYIAGHPSQNIPPIMWGLPVVLTTEIAAGTALAGAFARFARLVMGSGIEVEVSSEHGNNFLQGIKTIKAEVYATLAVTRETAFAKTDDIVVS